MIQVDTIIKTLALTYSDSKLKQFATVFLETFPEERLNQHPVSWWCDFLTLRYQNFNASIEENAGIYDQNTHTLSPGWGLDIIYPDSDKLFFTLQTLIREYELRVTLALHPMIAVDSTSIRRAAHDDKTAYSSVYIEFEALPAGVSIHDLKQRIHMHMIAVQESHKAQAAIAEKVDFIKQYLSDSPETKEWQNLLNWLHDNFFYYGYQAYEIQDMTRVKQAGIGILSDAYATVDTTGIQAALETQVRKKLSQNRSIYFDRIQAKSPVQRFSRLMRLSFKIKSVNHNFLGILRRSSLHFKNLDTPLIHLKMKYIFDQKNLRPGTYDYYEVVRLFTGIPKFELFRSSKETLLDMVNKLFSITNPNRVYCFPRKTHDAYCFFIYIPFNLYTSENCEKISAYIQTTLGCSDIETVKIYDSDKPRMHLYCDKLQHDPDSRLDTALNALVQPWQDQAVAYFEKNGIQKSQALDILDLLPADYQIRTRPAVAVDDYFILQALSSADPVRIKLTRFIEPRSNHSNQVSQLLVYTKSKIRLYDMMPILSNLGLFVLDQMTTRLGPLGYIQSYRVMNQDKQPLDEPVYADVLSDTIHAIMTQKVRNDRLNQLVLACDCTYYDVAILRTYCQLYAQIQPLYATQIHQTLITYPNCTFLLHQYFQAKFMTTKNLESLVTLETQFYDAIKPINSVDHDAIFRHLFALIQHTSRTNAYIKDRPSGLAIAVKLRSRDISFMPKPVPWSEIFVQDTYLDGCHIRFGPVSRGGLRWSSRLTDFRTEVLGLVAAQTLKNVIIVPDGAKGGFVIHGDTSDQALVEREYQRFIAALLDITDNQDESGACIHPKDCILYDNPDPYLVVAADKGTATFSDLANAVAKDYGFWLDDAFASGGQTGYDHKKEGITAKGAWECVKLHFNSLGINCQTEPVTVAGIGDMSGDVFGNGMLLSPMIRLQAAFNHHAIFIDPNPDLARSYAERQRLFIQPRSTWFDYKKTEISPGGGIYERDAKSIALSPEAKQMLGINTDRISGIALIQAILKMPVDLLWFGGIGTYIKASHEENTQVGDPANDGCRVSACDVQARVIGEGANLGITRAGRHELGNKGVLLNTDAIDNSAGVNMSDYEVNLKILVHSMIKSNHLTPSERTTFLVAQVGAVTDLCLANNRAQHQAITQDMRRCYENPAYFYPALNFIKNTDGLLDDAVYKNTVSRSDSSIIQAQVKYYSRQQVLSSDKPLDDTLIRPYLIRYFPDSIQRSYPDCIQSHPLALEIGVMQLVNHVVNETGAGFIPMLVAETGASVRDILTAYVQAHAIIPRHRMSQDSSQFVYYSLLYGPVITEKSALSNDLSTVMPDDTGIIDWYMMLHAGMQLSDAHAFLNDYDTYFGFPTLLEKLNKMMIQKLWARQHQVQLRRGIHDMRLQLYKRVLATDLAMLSERPSVIAYQTVWQQIQDESAWSLDSIAVLVRALQTIDHKFSCET